MNLRWKKVSLHSIVKGCEEKEVLGKNRGTYRTVKRDTMKIVLVGSFVSVLKFFFNI